ncbi:unnamed protein product [Camellia sinensis]
MSVLFVSIANKITDMFIFSVSLSLLLAHEGINAEQFAWDLKSFELKMTFEDVFPTEATIVEEYLQQNHHVLQLLLGGHARVIAERP